MHENHISSATDGDLEACLLPPKSVALDDDDIVKWEGRSPILKAIFNGGTFVDAFMMESAQLVFGVAFDLIGPNNRQ